MDMKHVDEEYQNQIELIGLKNDEKLKSYADFLLQQKLHVQHPCLWNKVQVVFVVFPISYLVEREGGLVLYLFC